MSSNSVYWAKRFTDLESALNSYGTTSYTDIEKAFTSAQSTITSQIESWYSRIATNNEISMTAAKKLLTSSELDEFKWSVSEYIKYGEENALNSQWIKQLENASAKYHISRLEALNINTQQALETAFSGELTSVNSMAQSVLSDGYYHTCYELQKGLNLGFDIGTIDNNKLDKLISSPWAADGKNFSDRIWQSKATMVNELQNELVRTCILGTSPDEAIKAMTQFVDGKFKNAKSQAGRLVMTEQAFFASAAQQQAFKELDVEEFEIVSTLDSKTSPICQEMDGKHFPMKDFKAGLTAPPFHCWCRSCTCPYFDDEFSEGGMRAARGEDGESYYVPDDMSYDEWKKSFVDGDMKSEQTQFVKSNDNSNVNTDLVNTKEYHDKFEGISSHKAVDESIYQESMGILSEKNGTDFESLVAIDSRTGEVIAKNSSFEISGKTAFNSEQYNKCLSNVNDIVLIHNHPNSSRPSYTDIKTLFNNTNINSSIVACHDGTVYKLYNPNRQIGIDKAYEMAYNDAINICRNKDIAKKHALNELYEKGLFDFEKR